MLVDFLVFYNFCIGHFSIGALVLEIFVLKVAKLYICTHRSSAQSTMFLQQHRRWDHLFYIALSKPQMPKTLLHPPGMLSNMYVPISTVFEHRCLESNYTEAFERAAGERALYAFNNRLQGQKSFLSMFSRLWTHFGPFWEKFFFLFFKILFFIFLKTHK